MRNPWSVLSPRGGGGRKKGPSGAGGRDRHVKMEAGTGRVQGYLASKHDFRVREAVPLLRSDTENGKSLPGIPSLLAELNFILPAFLEPGNPTLNHSEPSQGRPQDNST